MRRGPRGQRELCLSNNLSRPFVPTSRRSSTKQEGVAVALSFFTLRKFWLCKSKTTSQSTLSSTYYYCFGCKKFQLICYCPEIQRMLLPLIFFFFFSFFNRHWSAWLTKRQNQQFKSCGQNGNCHLLNSRQRFWSIEAAESFVWARAGPSDSVGPTIPTPN